MSTDDTAVLAGLQLDKAQECLDDARFLLAARRGGRSIVNRSYYAAFYAVLAVVFGLACGCRSGTDAGRPGGDAGGDAASHLSPPAPGVCQPVVTARIHGHFRGGALVTPGGVVLVDGDRQGADLYSPTTGRPLAEVAGFVRDRRMFPFAARGDEWLAVPPIAEVRAGSTDNRVCVVRLCDEDADPLRDSPSFVSAVDIATGRPLWARELPTDASPQVEACGDWLLLVDRGKVSVIGEATGEVAAPGAVIWAQEVRAHGRYVFAVDGDARWVRAYDPADWRAIWTAPLPEDGVAWVGSTLGGRGLRFTASSVIVVIGYDSPRGDGLLCLDQLTGERRWYVHAPGHLACMAAVSDEVVAFAHGPAGHDRAVSALRGSTGELLWTRPESVPPTGWRTAGVRTSDVCLFGGYVVAAHGWDIAGYEALTGRLAWRIPFTHWQPWLESKASVPYFVAGAEGEVWCIGLRER